MARRRSPSRFEQWALSPVVAYRVGLTLGYAATGVYFGVSAIVAGIPAFTIAAPEGWTPIWGSVLVVGGLVAAIGSVGSTRRFELIETWGAVMLFLTLGGYAGTLLWFGYGPEQDTSRAAVGAGFAALAVSPFIRLLWLLSQFGRNTDGGH